MTFSLLYLDKPSGCFAGATATGNLCVGGWVLRGHPHVGLTAVSYTHLTLPTILRV